MTEHNVTARILVVDDEEMVLDSYRRILTPSATGGDDAVARMQRRLFGCEAASEVALPSFRVTACSQGAEALDALWRGLEENDPHAVAFIDIRVVPGPDGLWIAEQLRKRDPQLEIVIVTGFSDYDPGEISRRVQPPDKLWYLRKPFHPDEIRQCAITMQAKWRVNQQLLSQQKNLETMVAERTAELLQLRDVAMEHASAKNRLLGTLSHEIRGPMNAIIGMADHLLQSGLDQEARRHVETILHSSESLLVLLDSMLIAARMDAGKLSLDESDFRLRDVIEHSCETFAIQAHTKRVRLVCQLDPDLPSVFRGDPVRLRQIMINLIGNAVKFTSQGDVLVNVTAATADDLRRTGQRVSGFPVKIAVIDNGIGISQDKLARIFDEFSQADNSISSRFGGSGLGLTITRKLVELMNGEIRVLSQEGLGSTFSVVIPLTVVELSQPDEVSEFFLSNADFVGKSFLIVDNSPASRAVLSRLFSLCGALVVAAGDGSEARSVIDAAQATQRGFDLMLMDCWSGELGGLDLVEYVKRFPGLVATTLLMLPINHRHNDLARCQELDVDATLIKPVQQRQLVETVTGLLKSRAFPGGALHPEVVSQIKEVGQAREKVESRLPPAPSQPVDEGGKRLRVIVDGIKCSCLSGEINLIEQQALELHLLADRMGLRELKSDAFELLIASRKRNAVELSRMVEGIQEHCTEFSARERGVD